MTTTDEILKLFAEHGDSLYGGERITQREHALQAATLAEAEQSSAELIVAALLHDVGHLLHDLPVDAPDSGIDDRHEMIGYHYVRHLFPAAVSEPIRLHVPAKRYLCTTDEHYLELLSPPSIVSLNLQGGRMASNEMDQFLANPFAGDAVRLRRWDDAAKIPGCRTPPLAYFASYLRRASMKETRE